MGMNRNTVIAAVIIAGVLLLAPRFLRNDQNYDLDGELPRFVSHEVTQLEKISHISKFRSGAGHDFSDETETCRSMKHYYAPFPEYAGNDIEIYSPVDGNIVELWKGGRWGDEANDHQIHIEPSSHPAFAVRIFHISIDDLKIGDRVEAGQLLGTAYMISPDNQTANDFDIAVHVDTREGRRYVPYFSVMTDQVFQAYVDRGAISRDQFIITKEYRDANPLECDGEWFTEGSVDSDWVYLN